MSKKQHNGSKQNNKWHKESTYKHSYLHFSHKKRTKGKSIKLNGSTLTGISEMLLFYCIVHNHLGNSLFQNISKNLRCRESFQKGMGMYLKEHLQLCLLYVSYISSEQ